MNPHTRVLLIEDGSVENIALREELTTADFDLECVGSPSEALRRVQQRLFDVLVTSPASSVPQDLEFVRRMRALRPGPRVVLLANQGTPEDVIASLRSHVFACFRAPLDVPAVAAMVQRAAEAGDWRDGISVVSSSPQWLAVRVAARRLTAERLIAFVDSLLSGPGNPEREGLALAFREILMNAMEHGAGFDPEKIVEVAAIRTARSLQFHFRDPGPGFSFDDLPHAAVSNQPGDPLAHVQVRVDQGMRPGGFGILMTRQLVDEILYNESGNEVLLIKHGANTAPAAG